MLPSPLVTSGEGEGLMQSPEHCELILASQSSPGELERPEQGWVKTAAPQPCWVPHCPPGGRRAVPSEDSLGRSEEHAGVCFSFARLLLGFCASSPAASPAAPRAGASP